MLYNSFAFIFGFLPVCVALYFLAAKLSGKLANGVLTAMSLVYYALFYLWLNWNNSAHNRDWRVVFVLLGSIAFNFAIGAMLKRKAARPLLILGVVTNLAALIFFKYGNFVLTNFSALSGHEMGQMKITLPLGISFFTFTQIAFLVDAYRGEAAELDSVRYGLFVTFFPHLIAGPIVHHRELMPQFDMERSRRWNPLHVNLAIAFFVLGLFKKVVIADTIEPWSSIVFEHAQLAGFADAWRGALAYTLRLYFDFSGYCDMAIGLGLLFNVRLPDNFDAPYRAESIVDFWRRWHMTLSRFLRDYLYIPLGGNRRGETRRRVNLFVTMLLGGIWHGAGWTYVLWGAYHGILLSIGRIYRPSAKPNAGLRVLSRALTFLTVVTGWVFFRAATVGQAGAMLAGMIGLHGMGQPILPAALPAAVVSDLVRPATTPFTAPSMSVQFIVLAILILFVNVAPTTRDWAENRQLNGYRAVLLAILFAVALLFMRTAVLTHRPSEFIYFQF